MPPLPSSRVPASQQHRRQSQQHAETRTAARGVFPPQGTGCQPQLACAHRQRVHKAPRSGLDDLVPATQAASVRHIKHVLPTVYRGQPQAGSNMVKEIFFCTGTRGYNTNLLVKLRLACIGSHSSPCRQRKQAQRGRQPVFALAEQSSAPIGQDDCRCRSQPSWRPASHCRSQSSPQIWTCPSCRARLRT